MLRNKDQSRSEGGILSSWASNHDILDDRDHQPTGWNEVFLKLLKMAYISSISTTWSNAREHGKESQTIAIKPCDHQGQNFRVANRVN